MYEYEDILCHHGVKGQKWGVIRKKQKSVNRRMGKEERAAKKVAKKENALRAKKEKLIRTGNADQIYKNRHLFTDEEYSIIMPRLQREKQLAGLSTLKSDVRGVNKAAYYTEKAASTLGKTAGAIASYAILSNTVNVIAGHTVLPTSKESLSEFVSNFGNLIHSDDMLDGSDPLQLLNAIAIALNNGNQKSNFNTLFTAAVGGKSKSDVKDWYSMLEVPVKDYTNNE